MNPGWGLISLERMEQAAEIARQRMLLAARALDTVGVPYAMAGDWGTRYWVERATKGGERGCVDVEIIVRRSDLPRTKAALESAGFHYRSEQDRELFLPSLNAKSRDAVELFITGGRTRPEQILPTPDVAEFEQGAEFRVLTLEALVRFSLSRGRTLDRVHVRDLIDMEMVDQSWVARLPPSLAPLLQHLLDTPHG